MREQDPPVIKIFGGRPIVPLCTERLKNSFAFGVRRLVLTVLCTNDVKHFRNIFK